MALDLFYQGSFDESLKALKKDLRQLAKNEYKLQLRNLNVAWGRVDQVGNNILFVTPPDPKKPKFNSRDDRTIVDEASSRKMNQFFLTRCHLFPLDKYPRDEIKKFSKWVHKVVDLVQPKLIVVMGEGVLRSSQEVLCPMCENQMEIEFTGIMVDTPSRTERNVPKDYVPQGGAGFGKLN
jgi:hypothetical protein